MKCVFAIILTAVASFAANIDFGTGQAARLVIGQPYFDSESDSASNTIVGAVGAAILTRNASSGRIGPDVAWTGLILFWSGIALRFCFFVCFARGSCGSAGLRAAAAAGRAADRAQPLFQCMVHGRQAHRPEH